MTIDQTQRVALHRNLLDDLFQAKRNRTESYNDVIRRWKLADELVNRYGGLQAAEDILRTATGRVIR